MTKSAMNQYKTLVKLNIKEILNGMRETKAYLKNLQQVVSLYTTNSNILKGTNNVEHHQLNVASSISELARVIMEEYCYFLEDKLRMKFKNENLNIVLYKDSGNMLIQYEDNEYFVDMYRYSNAVEVKLI